MTPLALGLLLTAAATHTSWNLLVKQASDKQIFTWWALLVGAVAFMPLLFFGPPVAASIWPIAIISALIEVLYLALLTRAYQSGDFSLVYPIARGLAPGLLAIWAVLFLSEPLHLGGVIGLGLLLLGLMVVGGSAWWAQRKTATVSAIAIGLALSVAVCISVYSVVDGAAVQHTAAVQYTVLVLALTALFFTPLAFLLRGRAVLQPVRGQWGRVVVGGLLSVLTYILVLQAFSMARVSYGGAIREVSIVFAAFIGWRWLGEGLGAARIVGAALMFAGIMVIAVAG